MSELSKYARLHIAGFQDFEPVTPFHPDMSGGLMTFRLPKEVDGSKLQNKLWNRFQIEVSIIEKSREHMIRISTHFFNTKKEIEHLREAIGLLLRSSQG